MFHSLRYFSFTTKLSEFTPPIPAGTLYRMRDPKYSDGCSFASNWSELFAPIVSVDTKKSRINLIWSGFSTPSPRFSRKKFTAAFTYSVVVFAFSLLK